MAYLTQGRNMVRPRTAFSLVAWLTFALVLLVGLYLLAALASPVELSTPEVQISEGGYSPSVPSEGE